MRERQGNMWDVLDTDDCDLFLVTTNAKIRTDGALVMGRGIAAQAKERYPDLPYRAGALLRASGLENGFYGLMLPYANVKTGDPVTQKLGLFQVKYHFKDEADLDIIQRAVDLQSSIPEFKKIHLNFPGIGNGRLLKRTVQPIVDQLDDRWTLWTL